MRRLPAALVVALPTVAGLLLAACTTAGGGVGASPAEPSASGGIASYSVVPVIVSSEQVVGPNRFLFSFLDTKTNAPAGSPQRTASVRAYPAAKGPSAAIQGDATFMWSIPDVVGVYRTELEFTEPGEWTLEFVTAAPGQQTETIPFTVDVHDKGQALGVGQPAVAMRTPTLDDVGGDVSKISSDKQPDPAFYRTSVDAALAAKKPFVLAFATPAFCTSGACGPVLDTVKGVAAKHPDLIFINVEPYQLQFIEGRLQPVRDANGALQTVAATDAYRIPSEPWTYVVDGTGTIVGSFEGPLGADELEAAIAKATAG